MSVMACVMGWRGAFKRGHEIQSQQGVSLGRQGSQWIDGCVNATDVVERCICVRHVGRSVCEIIRTGYVLPMAWSHELRE